MNKLESVSIRRATRHDLDALEVIWRAALPHQPTTLDLAAALERRNRFIYLAEDDLPFGFVCAGAPDLPISHDERIGEILGWCLKPAYWHHGMGRKLLVRGLSVLKRRHFEHAFLWLASGATRAVEVCTSVGFEPGDMTRTTNLPGNEVTETAYRISLAVYF